MKPQSCYSTRTPQPSLILTLLTLLRPTLPCLPPPAPSPVSEVQYGRMRWQVVYQKTFHPREKEPRRTTNSALSFNLLASFRWKSACCLKERKRPGVGHRKLQALDWSERTRKDGGPGGVKGRQEGRRAGGGWRCREQHPRSYLSNFTWGFPGLELPFGKEGTGKRFAVSPEDPLKKIITLITLSHLRSLT